jgi:C-terminal processing protease CtpA/Prc
MIRFIFVLAIIFVLLVPVAPRSQTSDASPEQLFESLWQGFDKKYALFEAKAVDWQALYDIYRPRVTPDTDEEELFEIMTAMLSHLNDNHVFLQAKSLGREFSAGYIGKYIKEMGLAGAMQFLARRPLPERYFRSPPETIGGERFLYGWVDDGIGYFHFNSFRDIDGSAAAVDSILKSFAGVRAMIVDVRRNSGGDDRVCKEIADRFADRQRLYMVTRDRNGPGHGDFDPPKYWIVNPEPRTFTGPVILLTNRLSVSSAENFALAMRVLPHVTVVGDFTSGCFADMAWNELPNGWRYSVSKNWFVDYAGRCWEGIGVPPDIMVPGEELQENVDPAFELALALLQGKGPALQNETASEEEAGKLAGVKCIR